MNNINIEKIGYRPKEVATYLGVSLATVWNYIKQGKLKTKKLSPQVTIITKEELEKFIGGAK